GRCVALQPLQQKASIAFTGFLHRNEFPPAALRDHSPNPVSEGPVVQRRRPPTGAGRPARRRVPAGLPLGDAPTAGPEDVCGYFALKLHIVADRYARRYGISGRIDLTHDDSGI